MFCMLNSPKLSVGRHKLKLVLDLLLGFFVCLFFDVTPKVAWGRIFLLMPFWPCSILIAGINYSGGDNCSALGYYRGRMVWVCASSSSFLGCSFLYSRFRNEIAVLLSLAVGHFQNYQQEPC